MSYFLQDGNGDLVIANNNLVLKTDALVEMKQRLTNALRWFTGEWFLDTSGGVPWLVIMKKGNTPAQGAAILKSYIAAQPGVKAINSFAFTVATNRRASLVFQAETDSGPVDIDQTVPLSGGQ